MKIGILTFQRALNYGAVLQAYSLCSYLESSGYEAEIIDYNCVAVSEKYEYTPLSRVGALKPYIARTGQAILHKGNRAKFNRFLLNNVPMSSLYTRGTIGSSSELYDAIVVGSDQVWNPSVTDVDTTYLLDFVSNKTKRIAYAPSLGTSDNFKKFGDDRIKNLKLFDAISCREEEGSKVLRDLGLPCENVVDPVFLINKEKWIDVSKQSIVREKAPYIFIYSVRASSTMFAYAKWLSTVTGYPVISTNIMLQGDMLAAKNGFRIRSSISPADFLHYLSNAECVVTDSFHGVSLSIILQKRFIVEADQRKQGNTNSRLDTLLNMCGLHNRYLKDPRDEIYKDKIDYSLVQERILPNINRSKQYLLGALATEAM